MRFAARRTGLAAVGLLAGLFHTAGFAAVAVAAAEPLRMVEAVEHCAAAPQQRTMWQDLADNDVCRVVGFGRVRGAAPPMFYQLQAYHTPASPPDPGMAGRAPGFNDDDGAGAVLLVPSPDGRTLASLGGWSGSGAAVEQPRIVPTPQGRILVLPMTATVSSHPSDDVVFRVLHGKWVQVSTHDWWKSVHHPSGAEQRNGNAMDWPTLRAYGAFWRHHDSECCPTGGSYIAQLRLDRSRLRLAHVRYSRHELDFP